MKTFLLLWVAVIFLVCSCARADFDPVRQADLADEIIGYRMLHSHIEMEGLMTEQRSEIIGKEIYRLCTMMNLPSLFMCNIGVRNWNRILPH